jgi:hypothetical protein
MQFENLLQDVVEGVVEVAVDGEEIVQVLGRGDIPDGNGIISLEESGSTDRSCKQLGNIFVVDVRFDQAADSFPLLIGIYLLVKEAGKVFLMSKQHGRPGGGVHIKDQNLAAQVSEKESK